MREFCFQPSGSLQALNVLCGPCRKLLLSLRPLHERIGGKQEAHEADLPSGYATFALPQHDEAVLQLRLSVVAHRKDGSG